MEALSYTAEEASAVGAPCTDRDLMLAAQLGQADAFEAIVNQYEQRVFRQCRRRGLSEDEAADVTQEVFIKAYRSLNRYQHQNAFRTWLYRVTENACIDHCRKRARDHAVVQAVPTSEEGDTHEFPSREPDPQAALEAAELRGQINAALAALAPILRDAFLLKEQEGLRYGQIAERLGCTLGTVKSRIYRARQELTARLTPLL
ncbi:MAG TPA: sigma-70 family RNA polymerase sigma factor [bacterium]|nr:sigma-70 family RNA polymerase sigma factor [bacterium]